MPVTVGNPTHLFEDFTIAAGNTAEQKYSTRTPCSWWAVQNHHATASLFVKTNGTDDLNNAIEIAAGQYKVIGPLEGQQNGYDLSVYQFVSGTGGGAVRFTVERKIA